ncbi:MAG: CARDB domain-containing protein [Candidatus Thermoplasmatota archaeon]|nr:CARDB domain-containing protein [Candidatus Thermoplasmatota archaeon]
MFNAVPIYAVLPAWLIYEIIKKLDFRTMHKNVYAMRYEKLRALRKGMKLKHVACVLFVVFSVMLPNAWGAIDAGIPYEKKGYYDKMIYDWLPSWLKKESYAGLQYLGTHGQSYLADYWFHGLKWLSTQDTELPIERRPAFIAWWDYGFQCVQDGRHPTIADNFQNGIPPAGNFITAQDETRAIAVFITRILYAQRTREGKLNDKVKATLSEYLDEENALKLENIITNPDYYLSEVLGNFDKCHKRTYDIADRQHNVGLHSENTMYAAAMVFFAEFDDALLVKLLHELEALTGHSIRYFAADQRMFPFNWANTGIYYAPTVLSDQDVNEFFEILIQGEVVDRKGDRVGDPTGFMTAEEFSEWRERMLERYTREYTPRALAYKLKYKEPFFKSMFYRAYIGYSGLDVGMDIDTFGIPGIHPELSGRPDWLATQHNLLPMPGWMQKHFRAVYINPGLRIMRYYEGANITGRVVTEGNEPVSNVHVTVIDDLGIPHDRVLTDSEGYFKLTAPFGMPENNYTVTIVASIGELDELGEKITQTSNSQLNTTTLRITYEEAREMKSIELNFTVKSCSLSGNAVWDDDESAISNCTAILRKGDKNFTNITLQDGYYEFKGLPPGTYQVFLNLSSTLRELDIAKSLEFSLPGESKTEELRVKPCTVNYTIYYDNNTIANASCSLCDLTNNTYYNETAVNGSFKVNKLLPGRYNITIYQPGYLKSEESFELLYGELRNKTITLYSSSKINGTAYIANKSKPATYAAIRFKNLETNKAEKTVTCENGSYEIELKCGRYSVSALHTDENVTWIYHALVVFNESYYMRDICLEQAAKLYGKVLLEGNGASGALVNFTSDSYNLTIKSNSTGYYEAYLSEGNYTIIAHHTFNESTFVHCERVSISAGAYLNRDLKLVEGVKVYGIVHYDVDETKDKPIRNLVLKFSSENGTLETTNLENYNVYLIGNRTYNIELDFSNADFKEDCFNLTLFNRTLYVTETRNESTDRLEPLEHNIFLKPKNASLVLNITCEKPVAGLNITIFLNATDDVALSTNITLNITAEAINYTFELNPGNYYIAVNYSSIKNEALIRYCYNESFNIELGTNETYHNITLEKELKVNGTVWLNTTDENRTLPNITLEFKLIDGTWDTTVLVDENASYEVWLKERNYSIFAEYILENITYQNGNATYQNITYLCLDSLNVSKHNYTKNITLVKAWEVNGTVYWAENETVKESVTLTFLHVASNITRNASVENGNYTILLLPGKYQVIVNHTEEGDYGNLTYTCEELLAVSQNKFYNISVNREIVIKLRGLAKYKDTDGKEQVIKNIELLITNTTSNITYNTTTDQNGNYIIYLAPGEYNISAKRAGFEFFSTIFNVGIQNYEKDLYLSITNITLVGFTYYDENMNNVFEAGDFVIPNVEIEFIGKELKVKSNATGFYNTSLQFGLYDIHVFYATAWGDAYGALDKLEITPDSITAEGEYLRNISMTRCFRVYGIGYYYNLTGIYKQASQNNISQIVNISINELKNITLDIEGCYQIILPKGEHRLRANITTFEYNMNVTYTCDEIINLTKTFEFNLNFTIPANATLTWNESELATIQQNETTQYNITIMNTGNLEDTFVLGFEPPEELGEGWKAEFNISNITLKPREVGSFMVNVTSGTRAKAGNNTVKITATSGRDVTRKASVDTVVNIKQLYGFNIKCEEFERGIHWNYTNSTTYSIKVFNEGNGIDSVNFSLEDVPLSWNASLDKDSVIFQKGYDEQEIKLTVTSPLNASVGERATIKIIGKSYWEDGSQRNISALNVTAIVSLPDLAITKIALSNSHPAPNETVTVNITVENLAIVDAKVEGDFKLNFYASGELINTTTVPELAAKQNITFSFNWTTPTSSGWYNLRADVLPANENVTFNELDKGNNAVTIRVLVGKEITYWRVIAFVLGIATFIIALALWRRIRRRR